MVITGKDARQELRDGMKRFKEVKSVEEKVNIIFKLITVIVKIVLATRGNTVQLMKERGIELNKPERPQKESKESTPEEEKKE